MSDHARTAYRARRMGFVFQFYNLLPVLSAVENVEMPLLVSRVQGKQARAKALRGARSSSGSRTGRSTCRSSCPAASVSA